MAHSLGVPWMSMENVFGGGTPEQAYTDRLYSADKVHPSDKGHTLMAQSALEAFALPETAAVPTVLLDGDREYLDAKFAAIEAAASGVSGEKVDEIHDSLFGTLVEPLTGIGTRELTLSDGSTRVWDMGSDGSRRTRTLR